MKKKLTLLQAQLYRAAAIARGIEVRQIGEYLVMGAGSRRPLAIAVRRPILSTNSRIGTEFADDKYLTTAALDAAGLPTPRGRRFATTECEAALDWFREMPKPVVVKPVFGSIGAGVTVGIEDEAHFLKAWDYAAKSDRRGVLVERHIRGKDHRLFVVGDAVVAAVRRDPASVTGDGESTIAALIAAKNLRRRNMPYFFDKPIIVTDMMQHNLEVAGLSLDSVLEPGRHYALHEVSNVGMGGESEDVTERVHPGFAAAAVAALRAIPGMGYGGLDLLAEDISAPPDGQEWGFCEINAAPEIGMHHFPYHGQGRDVVGVLMDYALGEDAPPAPAIRAHRLLIRGKVTRVGYRNWLKALANGYGIGGWARNVDAQTVEAVLVGPEAGLDYITRRCASGPVRARPETVEKVEDLPGNPDEMRDFDIR